MLHRSAISRPLSVLVATPAGRSGKGGIDRVMAALGDALDSPAASDLEVTFGSTRGAGTILLAPVYLAAFCLRMTALRLAGRCDVLHINLASHGSTRRKMIIAALARRLGIPYVLHLHGATYREYWEEAPSGLAHAIESLFSSAARIVVLGTVWRDFIARKLPDRADRIRIIPNATAARAHRTDSTGPVHILFLGRLGERKGVPVLVDALARLDRTTSWRVTLAGDGDLDATSRQIAAAGLGDRVTLTGWVDGPDVDRLLGEADILCLPSLSENLPMSVIEGMAAGLAVVTTPVGAVPDIISDGETGLIVPPGDRSALAVALGRLVSDTSERQRLGRAARAFHAAHLDLAPFLMALRETWWQAASERRPR